MDETEVIYGTIGTVPMKEYDPDVKYELLNLVSYDGSSYVVHTDPPVGTPPTDLNYWQVSAQGTGKATADSVGTVKPDGVTTAVNTDGALSVKTATNTTRGAVKGSRSINVSEDGGIYIPTEFTQATELVNLLSGEVLDVMLGKISKAIAVTMGLDQNALLKNMLTNIDADDQNKIPTTKLTHALWNRIGMGEDLDIGANLTTVVKALNSNLSYQPGEVINLNGFIAGGFLTGSNVDIYFSIPLPKKLNPSQTIINNISGLDVRQNGEYLRNRVDGVNGLTFGFTQNSIGLIVRVTKSGGWGGTNNDGVSIYLVGDLKIQ